MIARCLDLTTAVDRIGATFDGDRPAGEMNSWGNSYPAEELPFGRETVVDGIRYALVGKSPGGGAQPDHLEALGQRLRLPHGLQAEALAVLAAGELGPQELSVRLHLDSGGTTSGTCVSVTIPGWMARPDAPRAADQLRCSHLHYPGDYGLALLLPVLWSRRLPLGGVPVVAVDLLTNPLVHVFAVTLLSKAAA